MIEAARPEDLPEIDALLRAAFGGPDEAELVARLGADGDDLLSLVARRAGRIDGHIFFSPMRVTVDGRAVRTAALAPVAVLPQAQRGGVGSQLIREGLATLRSMEIEAAIVLGHPDYYPRFGFSAARAAHLAAPFSGPAFMAIDLRPGALDGATGRAAYAKAFGIA